jgi:hypothetical protein
MISGSSKFDEELSRCTVRIRAGDHLGSGFFVASRRVLTCAHVVRSAAAEISIEWRGHKYQAKVNQLLPDPVPLKNVYPDIAILEISENMSTEHPVVVLDEEVRIADLLYTFGYSDEISYGVGTTAEMQGYARHGESDDQRLLIFKNGQFRPGLSGSPILNRRTERVCGVLKRTRDKETDLGGEGITVSTLYHHFQYLREANDGGRGLILTGPEREQDITKVVEQIQKMGDSDNGCLDYLVYCAMPPLESRRAATTYATIVDQCRRREFVAIQLYDFPTYKAKALETVRRLIWRANLVIFDLTEEHPDVLYQLGYQDGIKVNDEGVLLLQQLPKELQLNFPPFLIKPFSDEKKLCEVVGERLDQLAKKRKSVTDRKIAIKEKTQAHGELLKLLDAKNKQKLKREDEAWQEKRKAIRDPVENLSFVNDRIRALQARISERKAKN